jgi:hypothetical protein
LIDEIQILSALELRKDDIFKENEDYRASQVNLSEMVQSFEKMTKTDFTKEMKIRNLPCVPLEYRKSLCRNIKKFSNVTEAKNWAIEQLQDATLASVDGSQVFTSRELTFPIALVQAGSFLKVYPEDLPKSRGTYEFETAPKILLRSDSSLIDGEELGQSEVGLERLKLEVYHAKELLKRIDKTGSRRKIMFLDDTLIYSFLMRAPTEFREDTIHALLDLMAYCRNFKTMLVGYIDTSYATDFSRLLYTMNGIELKPPTDAYYLNSVLKNLGDHTPPFLSMRKILSQYVDPQYQYNFVDQLCFAYLKVNSGRPVRVEFPRSIIEDGEFHSLMKIVLAEAILGDGYPHILTRAHEAAVIKGKDREKFYQIVYQYLQNSNITVQRAVKDRKKHQFF